MAKLKRKKNKRKKFPMLIDYRRHFKRKVINPFGIGWLIKFFIFFFARIQHHFLWYLFLPLFYFILKEKKIFF